MDIENADQLRSYLIQNNHIQPDEQLQIQLLHGGVSNRTVWVQKDNGEAWVLKQALEKLRVKVNWYCSPERVHREALGITWLEKIAPSGSTVPLIFEDHKHHIIAMKAVPQPHCNWKTMLLNGDIHIDHFKQFAEILATIHRESHLQKNELSNVFADRSFFEQLRIEPFYEYPASMINEAKPFLFELIDETRQIQTVLVHGDFSPKNILVHHGKLILIDHEVIHFGDPAFDIGFSMAHFLSKAHVFINQRTAFQESTKLYWQLYIENAEMIADKDFEKRCVNHTLGCLLARAAGRSTMDYMEFSHKHVQAKITVQMMQSPPQKMNVCINQFINGLYNNV